MTQHRVQDHEDIRQQTVLQPQHFVRIAASSLVQTPVNKLEGRIRALSEREAEVLAGLRKLRKDGLRRLAGGLPEWQEDNGLVYHRGRVYVPPDNDLRRAVLAQCHDHPTAGHRGVHSTFSLVSAHYWWPRMRAFVEKYVNGCDDCA